MRLTWTCRVGVLAVAALLMAAPRPVTAAGGGVYHRPISDFLEVQTLGDIVDWFSGEEGAVEYRARIDCLGVIDRLFATPNGAPFGTTVDGDVTERVREDGRTEVHISLHAEHAFGVVCIGEGVISAKTAAWGWPAAFAIGQGLGVNFCDADLDLSYVTDDPPGSPLPRLVPLLFFPSKTRELIQVHARASGTGELRELFGVEDGTPGRMTFNSKGIFNASFEGGVADWAPFPVNVLTLQPVGN